MDFRQCIYFRELITFLYSFSLFSYPGIFSSFLPLLRFLRPRSTLPVFFIFRKKLNLFKFFPVLFSIRAVFNFSVSSLICFTIPPTLLFSRILSKTPLVHSYHASVESQSSDSYFGFLVFYLPVDIILMFFFQNKCLI